MTLNPIGALADLIRRTADRIEDESRWNYPAIYAMQIDVVISPLIFLLLVNIVTLILIWLLSFFFEFAFLAIGGLLVPMILALWRDSVKERRLDYNLVFPVIFLYRMRNLAAASGLIVSILVVHLVVLSEGLPAISAVLFVGLTLLLLFIIDLYFFLRDGNEGQWTSSSVRNQIVVLFGLLCAVAGACWLASTDANQFWKAVAPPWVYEVLAPMLTLDLSRTWYFLYAVELFVVIRGLIWLNKFFDIPESLSIVREGYERGMGIVPVTMAILFHWMAVLTGVRHHLIVSILVITWYTVSVLALERLLVLSQREVFGPRG